MRFSSTTVAAVLASTAMVASPLGCQAFSPISQFSSRTATASSSSSSLHSTTEESSKTSGMSKKKEDRLNFMKSEQFHRRGFKEVRTQVEQDIEQQFQAKLVNDLKESNYMIENKEAGVKVYLAKDFGFCWGVERSIALAYEAVKHYPDRTLHITNELIHNPEVNDRLTEMKVNLIEKVGEGKKDFSTINEGDVVILPAFGASYEEMEMLDKKVSETRDKRTKMVTSRTKKRAHQVECARTIVECRSS
jgi:4-hydroxy-3-methylbut-2-en-1-yl diphosphate reductase